MSSDKRWRLVCYDVRDPKRYRQLYKVMRGHGRRVQYSIFRCRLDDREVERLRWKLALVLKPEDRLLIVDLCPSCASRVIAKNHVEGWSNAPSSFTIVTSQGRPLVDRRPTDDRAQPAETIEESDVHTGRDVHDFRPKS